jgi:hypothetical protein
MKQKSDKVYVFQPGAPEAISEDLYYKDVLEKLNDLLERSPNDETVFQEFFEKNPCLVPGSRDENAFTGLIV